MSDGSLLHRVCDALARRRWRGPRPDPLALAEWVAQQAADACAEAGADVPLMLEADDDVPLPRVRVGDDGLILTSQHGANRNSPSSRRSLTCSAGEPRATYASRLLQGSPCSDGDRGVTSECRLLQGLRPVVRSPTLYRAAGVRDRCRRQAATGHGLACRGSSS